MKKLYIVVAVFLLVATQAFAVESYAGLSVGPNFNWETKTIEGTEVQTKSIGMDITADGANYFGAFGVGYQVGVSFPFDRSMTAEGQTQSNVSGMEAFLPKLFHLHITGRYQHYFMDTLALEAGIGLSTSFGSEVLKDSDPSEPDVKFAHFILSIAADIGVRYRFSHAFALRGGIRGDIPVYGKITATDLDDGDSDAFATSPKGVNLTPYVGVVFQY